MKQLLKQDLENVKESFRRFSCFSNKEQGKMIFLAFPSEVDSGRYSNFLFDPYSKPEKRILNWYNAKPILMTIFSKIKNSGIHAEYDGLHKSDENSEYVIDKIIREITLEEITKEMESEAA